MRRQLLDCEREMLDYLGSQSKLSWTQQRLWLQDRNNPGGASSYLSAGFELRGSLDVRSLERAFEAVVRRHEALRSWFVELEGQPRQVVLEPGPWNLQIVDLRDEPSTWQQLARDEMASEFKSAPGWPIRARLYRLTDDVHVLFLAIRRLISDDHSISILIRDIAAFYAGYSRGQHPELPPVSFASSDFARMQRDAFEGNARESLLSYWRKRFAGVPEALELPTDRSRPAAQSHHGARIAFRLPRDTAVRLRNFAAREGASLSVLLLAGFSLLLSRYSGREDFLVGIPVDFRYLGELENVIGCFTDMVIFRADLSGNPSARQLLSRVSELRRADHAHKNIPLQMLSAATDPNRDTGRGLPYQVTFTVREESTRAPQFPGVGVERIELNQATFPVDLDIQLNIENEEVTGTLVYATDLFDESTVTRMADHLRVLLESMVAEPECCVWELPLLTRGERHQLLVEWNRTDAEYPRNACAHELFEAQAKRSPDAVAAVFESKQLSYGELNRRSNQLAHHLRKLGVGPDVLVGLCVERSLEMLIGLLGILKAGGAYVPLDPAYPKDRLAYVLSDTRTQVLLTQQKTRVLLPPNSARTICLDSEWEMIGRESEADLVCESGPEHLAYVIYTSGSTGRPKGVMIPHRGLVNYLAWSVKAYSVANGRGAPVQSSISFDLTVTALFSPLIAGRTVHLVSEGRDIEGLAEILKREEDFSLVKITPAHLQVLGEQLSAAEAARRTRVFVIGGENLRGESLAFWRKFAPDTLLVNEYGPTETVVGCCIYRVPKGEMRPGSVPIGRPISNVRMYILDRAMQPVPIGVTGELYIAGDGVARGYLNQPQLTAEKFIANPLDSVSSERWYRTGDLARYLQGGDIEFLGRADSQVKIRGFRIELGEIESTLERHSAVRECLVMVRDYASGDKRLIAYLTVNRSVPVAELRTFLEQTLPKYMVPSAFVILDAFPLTHNGKVDRNSLPQPEDAVTNPDGSYVPPRTPTEEALAATLCSVLGAGRIGVQDNLFDAGLDSLSMVRFILAFNRARRVSLGIPDITHNPTIELLAKAIELLPQHVGRRPAVVLLRGGNRDFPMYFIHTGPDELRIAHLISERYQVYGIEVPWPLAWREAVVTDNLPAFPTMDQLVARYVKALTVHVGSTRCIIVGHSFAGILAFETARQFRNAGGSVDGVFLLDAQSMYPGPYLDALFQLQQIWSQPPDSLTTNGRSGSISSRAHSSLLLARWLAKRVLTNFREHRNRAAMEESFSELTSWLDEQGMPLPEALISRLYSVIQRRYRLLPINARGFVFRTNIPSQGRIVRSLGANLGWENLFEQGIETIPVPGDHLSVVREHVATLAYAINDVLERNWT